MHATVAAGAPRQAHGVTNTRAHSSRVTCHAARLRSHARTPSDMIRVVSIRPAHPTTTAVRRTTRPPSRATRSTRALKCCPDTLLSRRRNDVVVLPALFPCSRGLGRRQERSPAPACSNVSSMPLQLCVGAAVAECWEVSLDTREAAHQHYSSKERRLPAMGPGGFGQPSE